MILLIDVGNSRLKWARAERDDVSAPEAVDHGGRPADVLATLALPPAEAVWVASVMGSAHDERLATAIAARCGSPPRFARTRGEVAGLRVAYAEPARLGVDRWLAMVALWTQRNAPFCVVNVGTALTFDAVDGSGRHLGGVIAPGLTTAQRAVAGNTRFEIRPQAETYDAGLGTDTESCVRQGALHACAGLIERLAQRTEGARYITGGDAATLRAQLDGSWTSKPNLVLEGLLACARAGA